MIIYNFNGCIDLFNIQAQCILRSKIPDRQDDNFNKIITLKEQILRDKLNNNDFNFTGANIFNLVLEDINIDGNLNFDRSLILGDVILKNVKIEGNLSFNHAIINGEVAIFKKSEIKKIIMYNICINERILITNSKINSFSAGGDYKSYEWIFNPSRLKKISSKIKKHILSLDNLDFYDIKEEYLIKKGFDIVNSEIGIISVDKLNIGQPSRNGIFIELVKVPVFINFSDCNINGDIWFRRVTVEWDCIFNRNRIKSDFLFELSKIKGKLSFEGTTFYHPYAQVNASREAKRVWDKLGDRDKTDAYYFQELEGKRKNNKFLRYPEWLFIQFPFGYGIIWYRVIFTFIFFILLFAFIFWRGDGIKDLDSFSSYLYASALTALKPGFSSFQPVDKYYEWAITIESIFGTFLWSISIVIFARKFIR